MGTVAAVLMVEAPLKPQEHVSDEMIFHRGDRHYKLVYKLTNGSKHNDNH